MATCTTREAWECISIPRVDQGKPAKIAFVENRDAVRKNLCLNKKWTLIKSVSNNKVKGFLRTADNSRRWNHYVDTCWHFIFDLLHFSLGQQLYVMSPAQLTHWTNLGTNLDNKCNCPIGPNRRSISLGNLWAKCTAQLPSLNLVNTCEYHAALQFSSRRSICRLYFCAKSHKLGVNPWQGPRLHSLLTVFAPLHCTQWWKPKMRNPRLRVDIRNL